MVLVCFRRQFENLSIFRAAPRQQRAAPGETPPPPRDVHYQFIQTEPESGRLSRTYRVTSHVLQAGDVLCTVTPAGAWPPSPNDSVPWRPSFDVDVEGIVVLTTRAVGAKSCRSPELSRVRSLSPRRSCSPRMACESWLGTQKLSGAHTPWSIRCARSSAPRSARVFEQLGIRRAPLCVRSVSPGDGLIPSLTIGFIAPARQIRFRWPPRARGALPDQPRCWPPDRCCVTAGRHGRHHLPLADRSPTWYPYSAIQHRHLENPQTTVIAARPTGILLPPQLRRAVPKLAGEPEIRVGFSLPLLQGDARRELHELKAVAGHFRCASR